MRIPSGTTDQVIYFVAVDATDFTTRETGLTTFTVYRGRNGGTPAAMTTPTVTEEDATNMPGVYALLLDEDMTIGSGNDSEEMVFHITHSGMAPVTRTIELYRPKITVGETAAVSGGAISNVTLVATTTTNTDMRGTDNALLAASAPANFGDLSIQATTGEVTALASAIRTAVGLASANLDTQLSAIDNFLDTEVAAILVDTGTTIPALIAALNNLSEADVRTALGLSSANLDTQLGNIPTNADLAARTLLAAAYATAASQTTIEGKIDIVDTVVDAVKAKTDSLTFTKALEVDVNIQSLNGVTLTGNGQTGTEFSV